MRHRLDLIDGQFTISGHQLCPEVNWGRADVSAAAVVRQQRREITRLQAYADQAATLMGRVLDAIDEGRPGDPAVAEARELAANAHWLRYRDEKGYAAIVTDDGDHAHDSANRTTLPRTPTGDGGA